MNHWGRVVRWVLLLLILAAAAVLRFTGINWDQFQHVHPDERFIVWVADTVTWPADAAAVLDPARSPLNPLRWPPDPANPNNELAGNPRNYAYGHFPLYLLVAAAHLVQAVAAWLGETTLAFPGWMQPLHTVGREMTSYNYLPLAGRALSALADLGTLLLVYALTRRVICHIIFCHAERVNNSSLVAASVQRSISSPASRPFAGVSQSRVLAGRPAQGDSESVLDEALTPENLPALVRYLPLLAAAAYAFAVLPIQLSHFAAVDAVLTFCVTATLALAVRRAEGGGWASWLLAGVMAGLAVGSKFSAVLLAVPLLVAGLYGVPAGATGRRLAHIAGRMAAVAATALVAFALTNPFALIEARAYIMQIFTQNAMVSGAMDAPYTRQYIGTLPYLYFVQQLSQWGLGWPLGAAAWGGFAWAIVRALRWRGIAPGPALVILLAWAVPYFATTGAFHAKFLRYMAPLLPCLLVCAAGWAAEGRRWLAGRFGGPGRAAWGLAAGLTLVFTVAWALAFAGVYRQEHPWIAASKWIYTNIPAGAKVLTEHWDDALPLALDELPNRPPKRTYTRVELPLWEPDTTEKVDALVVELSAADYLVLASNRLYAPVQRLRGRYPMGSQYYRMLFAGDLGYQQVADFTAYPRLLGLTIPDDNADESFTVYDHPRVLIFENVGRYRPELLRARLGRYLPAASSGAAPDENVAEHLAQAPQAGNLAQAPQAEPLDQSSQAEHPERSRGRGPGVVEGCEAALQARSHPSAGLHSSSTLAGRPAQAACLFSEQMPMPGAVPRPMKAQRSILSGGPQPVVEGREAALQARSHPSAGLHSSSTLAGRPAQAACIFSEQDACPRVHPCSSASYAQSSSRPTTPGRPPGLARMTPQTAAPGSALLDQPVDTLPVVADFRWNRAASASTLLAMLLWWLAVSLFGWAAWPLLFPVLRGLADRGYGLARPAGWLLVGWAHWLGVSLGWWENRLLPIAISLGVLVVAGLGAWRLQRRQIALFWAARRRLILGSELLFGLAYLVFVGVRLLNPDLWHPWNGGEKFMESAFLNAILRSAHFPPYDPYFAGGVINYYYYGFYLVSLPIKLTGIVPEVAFNLAVPALFALTAGGAFSVAYTLAAPRAGKVGTRTSGDERGSQHAERVCQPKCLTNSDQSKHAAVRDGRSARKAFDSGLSPSAHAKRAPLDFVPNVKRGTQRLRHRNARPALTALLSVGMTVLMGNLKGLDWFGKALASLVRGDALPRYDYWAASRVIPYTINEFPLWTFTFADLHPHLIAMPFGLLVVGLALNWVEVRGQGTGARHQETMLLRLPISPSPHLLVSLSTCLLLALSLGALGAINTWDVPTYGLLVAGAFLLAAGRRASLSGIKALAGLPLEARNRLKPRVHRTIASALALLLIAFLSLAAYWPFHASYDPTLGDQAGPLLARYLGWVRVASPLGDWLTVWGAWLFLVAGYLAAVWRGALRPRRTPTSSGADAASPARRDGPLFALLGLIGLLALLAALGRPTAALAALLVCLLLPLIFRRRAPAEAGFVALLVALALAVVAGTELVYVRDFLEGGEWYRMNSLFKFSAPAWLLLGVAGGPMLRRAWAVGQRGPAWLAISWQAAMVALLAGSLTFLTVGVRTRVDDRFPGRWPPFGTLDGTAYMAVSSYTWPSANNVIELSQERAAIRWLLDNVNGTPVIAEAPAGWYEVDGGFQGYDYYRAGGLRVASFTGLPTFLGAHQGEQRSGAQVGQRDQQGRLFFSTTDIAQARVLLRDLRVGYIYIGQLERTLFGADALRKFDVLVELGDLQVAYRNPQVTIYRALVADGGG